MIELVELENMERKQEIEQNEISRVVSFIIFVDCNFSILPIILLFLPFLYYFNPLQIHFAIFVYQ